MRRKFAREYGFVVPEIKLTDEINAPAKTYQIRLHGTVAATQELRVHEMLVVVGDGRRPSTPGDEIREPAFGMKALWIPEAFAKEAKREGFRPIDPISVMLTHLSETIHNNLARLLSYKDMRGLLDRLEPEYKRLLDDICPSQISHSGLLAVFKLLLAERVSIRNLNLILEAIAEIAPHIRRPEQIVEHVRVRISQQICGAMLDQGVLKVLRLGNRWDMVFHQSLKRDAKGEVAEFDIDPRLMEEFATPGLGRDPQAARGKAHVRGRHHGGDAAVRAHDHRAHVPDAAGADRSSKSRAASRCARSASSPECARDDRLAHLSSRRFLLFCRIGACLMIAPGVGTRRSRRKFVVRRGRRDAGAGADAARSREAQARRSDPIGMVRLIVIGAADRRRRSACWRGCSSRRWRRWRSPRRRCWGSPIRSASRSIRASTLPPLATLITLGATAMIFVADFHWQIVIGLVDSYARFPSARRSTRGARWPRSATCSANRSWSRSRIASPFFLYSVIVNFALALINRVTPQIAIFFIAPPFIARGGLALLYFTIRGQIAEFMAAFSGWLGIGCEAVSGARQLRAKKLKRHASASSG